MTRTRNVMLIAYIIGMLMRIIRRLSVGRYHSYLIVMKTLLIVLQQEDKTNTKAYMLRG